MIYKNVLSPWAHSDAQKPMGISERLSDLNGKVIGMYAHFKAHAVDILHMVENELHACYPKAKFSYFQYVRDTMDLENDLENAEKVREWAKGVDAVICAYGDAGSCSMFLCYNVSFIEKLGKPTVTLIHDEYRTSAYRGASARQMPALRMVEMPLFDLSHEEAIDERVINTLICPAVQGAIQEVIDGLLRPLTEEERHPSAKPDYSSMRFEGTLEEINDIFYHYGWTNGQPIIPPTEEAVEEMLQGTDLPRDYVVGKLPPMNGYATIEKIAINAVMAGCLPTYLPVLIASVKCMMSSAIQLEGWTCSNASWMPMSIISGRIAKDIHMNSDRALLSPYYKPNATIPRAIALIVMNISGVRQGTEDMSYMGSIGRFGVCFSENTTENPWGPLHVDYGFAPDSNCLTMFWPGNQIPVFPEGPGVNGVLRGMCNVFAGGWAPGCLYILPPGTAKELADAGWSRQRVLDYVVEYDRIPGTQINLRWIAGNNHLPGNIDIPVDNSYSTRVFWNKKHLLIVVAGMAMMQGFTGGGDHGGPACEEIDLPTNWKTLVKKYDSLVPSYIDY